MTEWIYEIVDRGVRRPAYPADLWVEDWSAERFTEFGLEDVRKEPVGVHRWDPGPATLAVQSDGRRFTGFPLPHAAAGVVEGELALAAGDPPAEPLAGRIAVYE